MIRRSKLINLCEVETSEINGVDLVLDSMNDLGWVVADRIKKRYYFVYKDCLIKFNALWVSIFLFLS